VEAFASAAVGAVANHRDRPPTVPLDRRAVAVDACGRFVQPARRAVGERVATPGRGRGGREPALPHHAGDGGAHRGSGDVERCEQLQERRDRGGAAAQAEMVAVQVEQG
jgi:hypothetical protein